MNNTDLYFKRTKRNLEVTVLQLAYEEEIDHLTGCNRFPVACPRECKKKDIPREEVRVKDFNVFL